MAVIPRLINELSHDRRQTLSHNLNTTAYKEIVRDHLSRVSSVVAWDSPAKGRKIREVVITRDLTDAVSVITKKAYDDQGALYETLAISLTRLPNQRVGSVSLEHFTAYFNAQITAPQSGSSLPSADFDFTLTVSDARTITSVVLMVDGEAVATLNAAPYTTSVSGAGLADGPHSFSARITDAAGFTQDLSITAMKPTEAVITLTSPISGSTITDSTQFTISITNGTLTRVEYYDGLVKVGESTAAPFSAILDTSSWATGQHNISAKGVLDNGIIITSPTIQLTKEAPPTNEPVPPVVSNVVASPTTTGATIQWDVAPNATGQVFYGTSTSMSSSTTKETGFLGFHSQVITGLSSSTQYYFQIESTTAEGVTTRGPQQSFTTGNVAQPPDPLPTSAYPPDVVGLTKYTQPYADEPALLGTPLINLGTSWGLTSPEGDTITTRVSDYPHHYSKDSPWNCDETLCMTSPSWRIHDGETYQYLRTITSSNRPNEHKVWSNTDPRYIYGAHRQNRQWRRVDATTGEGIILKTYDAAMLGLPSLSEVSFGDYESSIDNQDRYAAMLAKLSGSSEFTRVFIIDPKSGDVLRVISNSYWRVYDATISQDGTYLVVSAHDNAGSTNDASTPIYNDVYSIATGARLRRIANGSHYDVGVATNGRQVIVSGQFYVSTNPTYSMVYMDTGERVKIFEDHPGRTNDWLPFHVSCRNIKRPGWAYFSQTYSGSGLTKVQASNSYHRIIAVKLDGSGTIENFAWDHSAEPSSASSGGAYDREIMVAASPTGSRVWWKAAWNVTDAPPHSYVSQRRVAPAPPPVLANPYKIGTAMTPNNRPISDWEADIRAQYPSATGIVDQFATDDLKQLVTTQNGGTWKTPYGVFSEVAYYIYWAKPGDPECTLVNTSGASKVSPMDTGFSWSGKVRFPANVKVWGRALSPPQYVSIANSRHTAATDIHLTIIDEERNRVYGFYASGGTQIGIVNGVFMAEYMTCDMLWGDDATIASLTTRAKRYSYTGGGTHGGNPDPSCGINGKGCHVSIGLGFGNSDSNAYMGAAGIIMPFDFDDTSFEGTVAEGTFHHALRWSCPDSWQDGSMWPHTSWNPAVDTDRWLLNGQLMRLDPSFDIVSATGGANPTLVQRAERRFLKTLQVYGSVQSDYATYGPAVFHLADADGCGPNRSGNPWTAAGGANAEAQAWYSRPRSSQGVMSNISPVLSANMLKLQMVMPHGGIRSSKTARVGITPTP